MSVDTIARHVYLALGPGHSESVYHNAMEVGLRSYGIPYETERIIPIEYEGHIVGNMRADLIVNKEVIVELKSVRSINDAARLQAQQYMKLLGLSKAIVINFGLELQIEELTWSGVATV